MNEVRVMRGTRLGKYLACAFAVGAFFCAPAIGAWGGLDILGDKILVID